MNAPQIKIYAKIQLERHGPMTASQIAGEIHANEAKIHRVLRRTHGVYHDKKTDEFELVPMDDPRWEVLEVSGDLTTCDWYPRLFGQAIMHSWAEIAFLEQLLSHYKFSNIIELGTASGGLTTLFMLHSLRTGSVVTTIDINDEPNSEPYNSLKYLTSSTFLKGDAIKPNMANHHMISRAIRYGDRTLLYCDANGYKEARVDQMKQWLPYLKVGDIVISHDYPYQITDEQVKPLVDEYNLVPFHQEEALEMGCRMLLYERKQ